MNSLTLRLLFITVFTLILCILPLPESVSGFRPPWIFLLVFYIQCFLPRFFHLSAILLLGLCQDVLLSTILGEHAFALLVVTWITNAKSRRLRFFTMSQQLALVGVYCFAYQSIILSIDALLGFSYDVLMPIKGALVGLLLWPWVRLVLDEALHAFYANPQPR
jgi:rod shape-determining protein MreD